MASHLDQIVFLNGEFIPGRDARISIFDRGLLFADAVYEGLGVLEGNIIDFDMSVTDAVSAPRFSATSDVIDVTNRIPEYLVEPLRQAGYEVYRLPTSFGIAGVHAIEVVDGVMRGAADPGLDGVALGVEV